MTKIKTAVSFYSLFFYTPFVLDEARVAASIFGIKKGKVDWGAHLAQVSWDMLLRFPGSSVWTLVITCRPSKRCLLGIYLPTVLTHVWWCHQGAKWVCPKVCRVKNMWKWKSNKVWNYGTRCLSVKNSSSNYICQIISKEVDSQWKFSPVILLNFKQTIHFFSFIIFTWNRIYHSSCL